MLKNCGTLYEIIQFEMIRKGLWRNKFEFFCSSHCYLAWTYLVTFKSYLTQILAFLNLSNTVCSSKLNNTRVLCWAFIRTSWHKYSSLSIAGILLHQRAPLKKYSPAYLDDTMSQSELTTILMTNVIVSKKTNPLLPFMMTLFMRVPVPDIWDSVPFLFCMKPFLCFLWCIGSENEKFWK